MRITDLKVHILKPGELSSYGQLGIPKLTPWSKTDYSLVRVLTDEGIEGDFLSRHAGAAEELANRFSLLKDELVGHDVFDREKLWKRLAQQYLWPMPCLCALDVCLWDIAGKALQLPIYKLLGAYREKILAYASTVIHYGSDQAYTDLALELKRKGFKALKLHPYGNVEDDLRLCRAVRAAVGDEMLLMLDPISYPGPYERLSALRLGRELEKLNFYWFEDPIPTTDVDGLVDLCRSLDLEILMGERNINGIHGYTELLRRRATDALRGLERLVGGITPMMKIAHLAECFSMKFEPHSMGVIPPTRRSRPRKASVARRRSSSV
jgi:L-alanine-DL-glutamate epimerase-like enolase superfamily enzyme